MSDDALSTVDGRYRTECRELASYFSERALVEERVKVELDYLRLLCALGVAPRGKVEVSRPPFGRVKELEAQVEHDVKAVELFLREELGRDSPGLLPYIHLGLTSEDTNSVARGRLLARSLSDVLVPLFERLARGLCAVATEEAGTPMLARTHGRPAVPTTFGREMAVFAVRLAERIGKLGRLRPVAKMSGAVGTYASFFLIAPDVDWPAVLGRFVGEMGLDYAPYATQVPPAERLSDIAHCVINVNQLMLGLSRDLWMYQAMDYVGFDRKGSVSSSTMPQKVNPVDLENAEGQVEVSNSLLLPVAYRLQVSRWQRDLSDSVIGRTVGQAFAHSVIACKRVLRALGTMHVNRDAMLKDLRSHEEVFAEAAQLLLRLKGDEAGYDSVRKAVEGGSFSPPVEAGAYLGISVRMARAAGEEVDRLLSAGKS